MIPENYEGPRCKYCDGFLPEVGEFQHMPDCLWLNAKINRDKGTTPELKAKVAAAIARLMPILSKVETLMNHDPIQSSLVAMSCATIGDMTRMVTASCDAGLLDIEVGIDLIEAIMGIAEKVINKRIKEITQ